LEAEKKQQTQIELEIQAPVEEPAQPQPSFDGDDQLVSFGDISTPNDSSAESAVPPSLGDLLSLVPDVDLEASSLIADSADLPPPPFPEFDSQSPLEPGRQSTARESAESVAEDATTAGDPLTAAESTAAELSTADLLDSLPRRKRLDALTLRRPRRHGTHRKRRAVPERLPLHMPELVQSGPTASSRTAAIAAAGGGRPIMPVFNPAAVQLRSSGGAARRNANAALSASSSPRMEQVASSQRTDEAPAAAPARQRPLSGMMMPMMPAFDPSKVTLKKTSKLDDLP